MITWNIGSLTLHRDPSLNLLNLHQPHTCFLQEAQLRNGIDHSLRVILAPMGYSLLVCKNNLCSVVRHGMNVAPVALSQADKDNRAQRLALQMGARRILIRHRDAHSGSAAARQDYNDALSTDESGRHTIDIGDFNEYPVSPFNGESYVLFPRENTYRLNSADEHFISCIDGCIVSQNLASSASATALEPGEESAAQTCAYPIGFQSRLL